MFIYHDLYSLKKLIALFPLDFTLALAGNIIKYLTSPIYATTENEVLTIAKKTRKGIKGQMFEGCIPNNDQASTGESKKARIGLHIINELHYIF